MVRNLPVDVARKAGCEIIIAVNLGTPPLRRDQLTSVAAVALQSINLMTEQNVKASLAELTEKDILIEPKLGEFSSGDFARAMDTIPIGIAAARAVQDKLERLSVSDAQLQGLAAKPRREEARGGKGCRHPGGKKHEMGESRCHRVGDREKARHHGVSGDEATGRKGGLKKLEEMPSAMKKKDGEEMDLTQLQSTLTTIYGRGDFERLDYSLVEKDGKEPSWSRVSRNPGGPTT